MNNTTNPFEGYQINFLQVQFSYLILLITFLSLHIWRIVDSQYQVFKRPINLIRITILLIVGHVISALIGVILLILGLTDNLLIYTDFSNFFYTTSTAMQTNVFWVWILFIIKSLRSMEKKFKSATYGLLVIVNIVSVVIYIGLYFIYLALKRTSYTNNYVNTLEALILMIFAFLLKYHFFPKELGGKTESLLTELVNRFLLVTIIYFIFCAGICVVVFEIDRNNGNVVGPIGFVYAVLGPWFALAYFIPQQLLLEQFLKLKGDFVTSD